MYTVRRLREPIATYGEERVEGSDHRDAVVRSLLAEPGAQLIVSDGHTVIRYHVDAIGRIVEQSRFTS